MNSHTADEHLPELRGQFLLFLTRNGLYYDDTPEWADNMARMFAVMLVFGSDPTTPGNVVLELTDEFCGLVNTISDRTLSTATLATLLRTSSPETCLEYTIGRQSQLN